MTVGSPRTRVSAGLSVAVATLAVVALGMGVGEPGVLAGVAGALAFAWGVDALAESRYPRRAAGSVAVVAGGLAALWAVSTTAWVAPRLAVAAGVAGLAVLASGASGGVTADRLVPVRDALTASLVALGVALASAVVAIVVLSVLAPVAGGPSSGVSFVPRSPLGALFAVQVLALVLVALLAAARRAVARWFRGAVPVDSWDLVEALPLSYDRLPFVYWASLPFQALLAAMPAANAAVERLFASLWLFGAALDALLTTGALLGLLVLVASVPVTVLVAEAVRQVLDATMRPVPVRKAAFAAGGVAAAVAGPVGLAVGSRLGVAPSLGVGAVDPTVAVLGALLLAVGGLHVLAGALGGVVGLVERRTGDVVVGAGLLLLATVAAAVAGGPGLAVFGGVAATLAAWDLGTTAADLGRHVGGDAETRRAEVVHATGTVGVGVVGVALAAVAASLVGPLAIPAERAGAAAVLALVGLLATGAALAVETVP